ncbi:hydroxyacid dehydrogenase [Candidatus Woesearchaeota archaeon]|jgi:D-lactate dehydrogenase|nr:hydroxyacid dehydrogenase [Candidatus Woesearchaeota archaeon]MBT5397018.1 hydroxyacid dehydrogenase [Candidatus Woesearchaeota archaeon]MBT5924575.1 hydroxyacid dehydrogenase [Candidatus Woesearchaeota archaeon]MBT6367436.1 hydroxyacid dehydrogenase [Candidatus Woesearchaeota archaeon]MBT7762418.1 hydroxyacid dehydrogenase [Candidatus Woesearchaeota archaeon]
MKIGFFEIEPWEKKLFQEAFPHDTLLFSTGKLTAHNASKYKDLNVISTFVYSEITEQSCAKLTQLQFLVTRSTGYNHIDLAACKKHGISVSNIPVYGENTVAEYTFALILALSRKFVDSVERTKSGSFDLDGLRGFDLKGKTLGIIGCGSIGEHVVRIAKGFEMNVKVFDVHKNMVLAKKLGFSYAPLDTVLKTADVVTLHVPLNTHTHHLINAQKLSLLKKTAFLVNTSRGEIIDTKALLKVLNGKKIAGAALDVLEEECNIMEETELLKKSFKGKCDMKTLIANHALLKMSNVIITPHNAFNTHEALQRILDTTILNIKQFKKKKKVNIVT